MRGIVFHIIIYWTSWLEIEFRYNKPIISKKVEVKINVADLYFLGGISK